MFDFYFGPYKRERMQERFVLYCACRVKTT